MVDIVVVGVVALLSDGASGECRAPAQAQAQGRSSLGFDVARSQVTGKVNDGGENKGKVGSGGSCEGGAGGEWVGWMKKGGMGDSKRLFSSAQTRSK